MPGSLKFVRLYVAELLLWLPLLAGFYALTAFLAAEPVATLDLGGRSLPAGWKAAVPNHGRYLQGYLIERHPVSFGLALVALLGSGGALYLVHRAQARQRRAEGASAVTAHRIAHAGVFVVLGVAAFAWMRLMLAGVAPA